MRLLPLGKCAWPTLALNTRSIQLLQQLRQLRLAEVGIEDTLTIAIPAIRKTCLADLGGEDTLTIAITATGEMCLADVKVEERLSSACASAAEMCMADVGNQDSFFLLGIVPGRHRPCSQAQYCDYCHLGNVPGRRWH